MSPPEGTSTTTQGVQPSAAHGASVSKGPGGRNAFDDVETWRFNLTGDEGYVSGPKGERPAWFWTGKAPVYGVCPGMLEDGTMTSLPIPDMSRCTRQDVLDYFDNSWTLTEVIFSALQGEEAYYRPPYHNLRHPMVFYYCHPAALYINKFRVAKLLQDPINAFFERIFETGVDEMSWDDLSKNEMRWPSLRECTEYRRAVYRTVRALLETHPCLDEANIGWDKPAYAIFMAFEHERIHLETSSVLMRELPLLLVRKPNEWPAYHPNLNGAQATPTNDLVEVPAGDVTLGKPHNFPTFGWDNEFGSRSFHVRSFKASRFLVTNGEFLEFVKEGGYRDKASWTEQGWKWRTFRNAKWPCFWVLDGPAGLHQYKLRLCFELVDMPLSAPAIVNHHEAKAYCNWLSAKKGLTGDAALRLMTEPEHNRLRHTPKRDAEGRQAEDPVAVRSGKAFRGFQNLNLAYGAESPVDALAPTPEGFYDTMGNAWVWCEDFFASLPNNLGVHEFYDDFSTPCYDGEHNIILGGSFVSTGDEASVFARFHFRPHFFQHAGFRIVSGTGPKQTSCMDSPPPHVGSWDPSTNKKLKTQRDEDEDLGRVLLTHYAPHSDLAEGSGLSALAGLGSYSQRLAAVIVRAARESSLDLQTVLEVGCSVGGTAFELARDSESVLGVDLNHHHIQAAQQMKRDGFMVAQRKDEGLASSEVRLGPNLDAEALERVTFKQMEPTCLSADFGDHPFSAVVVNQVLEKAPSPKGILSRMGGDRAIVRPGGLLVVASSFNWDENVCDRKLWIGGASSGASSADALRDLVCASGEYEAVSSETVAYLEREHARRYQLSSVHVAVFRRRVY